MRVLGFFIVGLIWFPIASHAEPVRIVTLNTFWLYDDASPHASWGKRRDPQTYPEALSSIANALSSLQPDIIVLQEIEGPAALADLRDALDDAGHNYPHLWAGEGLDPYTGQDVAVLSKYAAVIPPVLRYPESRAEYFTEDGYPRMAYLTKFMRVDFEIGDDIITLFAGHLKSQRGGDTADFERLAQAKIAREIVRGVLEKGRPNVILAGDLNDDRGSQVLRVLRGSDGSWPLYQTTDGRLSDEEAWTYDHDGKKQQLDHILVSKSLNDCLLSVDVARFGREVSDHAALLAEFDIGCTP